MNRRGATLIFLALAFAGLAILTLVTGRGPSAQIPGAPTPTDVIPFFRVFSELSVYDLVGVRLRSPETGAEFTMARDPAGNWVSVTPEGALDAVAANAIARTMVLLPYTQAITPDQPPAQYGFTPEGILSIELLLADGGGAAVALGYRTPTETGYYAFVDDRPEVFILDRAPIDYLISILRQPPIA